MKFLNTEVNASSKTLKQSSCNGARPYIEQFEFTSCAQLAGGEIQVFLHHIYEYEKGVRNLILHTLGGKFESFIKQQLERKSIPYLIRRLSNGRLNVFFGEPKCIRVLSEIGNKSLKDFTDEEDFILGIMLGYGIDQQCERFLKRKNRTQVEAMVG